MLGFGSLGRFALGEGPFEQRTGGGSQWQTPVRRARLAVAIVAGSFTGFVPQPPAQAAPVFTQFSQPQAKAKSVIHAGFTNTPQPAFVQPYVFSAFSQPLPTRVLIDEIPSSFFEPEPPILPPFTGFCTFEVPFRAKLNIALISTRWWQPITLPVDTHDGVFVKKKRKKHERDPIDIELEEKARRRAAIQLAVYGPEPLIPAQISPEKPVFHSIADVTELTKLVLAARQAEQERIRAQQIADDEDDLESILKDIL